jgi:anti-sigma factor RsiW
MNFGEQESGRNMTCVPHDTLQTFIDNELDADHNARVATHLSRCAECSREVARVLYLKRAIHQAANRYAPSPAFQRRIIARYSAPQVRRWWKRAMIISAATVTLVFLAASLSLFHRERGVAFCRELADLHVTTLASAVPVDVVSSDRHTVKPWFAGKLPFTFNVPDLHGSPYELVGGRMAFLNQAPAAQLIFKCRDHRISVFIVQQAVVGNSALHPPANFTLTSWRANGLAYFLVTDAAPGAIDDLVTRMKKVASGPDVAQILLPRELMRYAL